MTNIQTYQDMGFVRKRVVSLLCDEKQLVKEEEGPLVLGPLEAKGSFEHQFPVAGQVWPLPVSEKTLYLLKKGPNCVSKGGRTTRKRGKGVPFAESQEWCLTLV